jgi:hypothetical protein
MKRLTFAFAFAAASCAAFAQDAEIRRHPAFVDGSAFVELAGENGELVEVSIGPALLNAIASGEKKGSADLSALSGLKGIYAYVVGLEDDPVRTEKARKLAVDIEAKLVRENWERVVRVRDKGERVNVFTKPGRAGEGKVDGLVVIVFDGDGSEVVFCNLVGTIDLAKLGAISDSVDVPGLDLVPQESK